MKKVFTSDQRGVGHLGLILALVVVLGIGGVGYFVYSKNKTDGGTVNPADSALQEAIKNAKCDYDDKDLCKFFTSYKLQQDLSVTTVSKADGKTTTMTLKSQGSNRTHLTMTGEMTYEVINISGTTYTKAPDGTWWKQTAKNDTADDLEGEAKVDFDEPAATAADDAGSYAKQGKEKCGNLTCFKYKVADPGDSSIVTYFWFDDKDYQLRRTLIESNGSTTDSTYSYEGVSVSEPSPVKTLGENQFLMPGQSEPTTLPATGDAPSEEELRQLMEQYQ